MTHTPTAQPRVLPGAANSPAASVVGGFHSPHNAADPEPAGFRCPTRPTALASVDARRPALQRAASASGTPFVTDCLSSATVRRCPRAVAARGVR